MKKGRILIVDDDELIVSVVMRAFERDGYQVRSRTNALDLEEKVASFSPDVVLLDIGLSGRSGLEAMADLRKRFSETHVVILTADDTAETAINAMKLGAVDYVTKPFEMEKLKIVIGSIMEKEDLRRRVDYLSRLTSPKVGKRFIGESSAMRELKEKADKLAGAKVSAILITGESGTGKELLARYLHGVIHGAGDKTDSPFVGINCSGIPEHLMESELFGHVKGAFTDAGSDKRGIFELANDGSLLLDEIGEMRTDLQSKLLRVLEERSVRRIGGKKSIPLSLTVMATTNIDISRAVEKASFRSDLFYRLSAFTFHIPPLRHRKEDIMPIALHYLDAFSREYKRMPIRGFSPEAEELMASYPWPGNIRELKNVVERMAVLGNTEIITPDHLPREIGLQEGTSRAEGPRAFTLPEKGISLDEVEETLIRQALVMSKNNMAGAARLLSIGYDALRYKIKKFGLE